VRSLIRPAFISPQLTSWSTNRIGRACTPPLSEAQQVFERDRGFADSPLEEGVYCELVSESEISEVSIPVRFWAILVS
jgi:hypothetical protein